MIWMTHPPLLLSFYGVPCIPTKLASLTLSPERLPFYMELSLSTVWPDAETLFVSGPLSFCEQVGSSYCGSHSLYMALDLGASPSPLLEASNLSFWDQVAHAGKWWCHSTTPGTSPFLPQLSLRRLRHIVSFMVRGRPHPPPTQPDSIFPAPFVWKDTFTLGVFCHPQTVDSPACATLCLVKQLRSQDS